MIMMERLLDNAMQAATNYNLQNPNWEGVAFRKLEDGINAASIASQFFCIDVINVQDPKDEFYSFVEGKFQKYPYPVSTETLLKALYNPEGADPVGKIVTRYSSIMNYVASIPKIKREKSRLILHPNGVLNEGEIILKFKTQDGKKICFQDGVDKAFIPIEDMPIPASKIIPGHFYKCIFVAEEAGAYIVRAVECWGKVNVDLVYTQGLYDKESMPEINPAESFGFGVFEGNLEELPEIHISTRILHSILQIFNVLPEDSIVEIELPRNPMQTILVRSKSSEGEVTARFATIDPYKTKQRS